MRTASVELGVMGNRGRAACAEQQVTFCHNARDKVERCTESKDAHGVTLGVSEAFATSRKASVFVVPVESLNFARATALDPQAVMDVISKNETHRGYRLDTSSRLARLEVAGKGNA